MSTIQRHQTDASNTSTLWGGVQMSLYRRVRLQVLLVVMLPSAQALAQDVCRDVLVYAARNWMTTFSREEQQAWAYHHACKSSGASMSLGLEALVEGVPVVGSLSASQRKDWCSNNQRYEAYSDAYSRVESTVSKTAVNNWLSCTEAAQRSLTTKARFSPNEDLLQLAMTNGTPETRRITRMVVQTEHPDAITCQPEPTWWRSVSLPPSATVSVDCTRSYVKVRRGGEEYEILPGGSISIDNGLAPFIFGFPERFKVEAVPRGKPERILFRLDGMHIGTNAYWAAERAVELQQCHDLAIPEGFSLVEVGRRETGRVWGRGLCGRAPMCDGHNEWCKELFYVKACLVNDAWHDWYKADMAKVGVPYSKEAVCSP